VSASGLGFEIHPDIELAEALPPSFYVDPTCFELVRERVFARSWQFAGEAQGLEQPGCVRPFTLCEGFLDEPLFFARGTGGELRCLSNVCTHRANRIVEREACEKALRCSYHGRVFDLDGRYRSAPEFQGARAFPRREDDLRSVALAEWGPLLFVSLDPALDFDWWMAPLGARLAPLPLETCVLDPTRSRDFTVQANWALYVDNYLEGLHIPFAHPGLDASLDFKGYRTELFPTASLQVGPAAANELAFELPEGHPDFGRRIAAYYAWLFPSTMLNVYPWGISLNSVCPRGIDATTISFRAFVSEPALLDRGAGKDLERVELEDEALVERVQRGVRSRLCPRGRYSPSREQGVHHFHRLLVEALGSSATGSHR
jgi:nitrite reductase/ring-hydroxylating ferredoxin subunit